MLWVKAINQYTNKAIQAHMRRTEWPEGDEGVRMETNETIRIPIEARFSLVDGKAVVVSAEYADIPVDVLAKDFYQLYEKTHDQTILTDSRDNKEK